MRGDDERAQSHFLPRPPLPPMASTRLAALAAAAAIIAVNGQAGPQLALNTCSPTMAAYQVRVRELKNLSPFLPRDPPRPPRGPAG